MFEELEIKVCYLHEVAMEFEYQGYYFLLSRQRVSNIPCWQPSLMRKGQRDAVIAGDRDLEEVLYELNNMFTLDDLEEYLMTLLGISIFYYDNVGGVSRKDITNGEILDWLNSDDIHWVTKSDIMDVCEWVYLVGNKREKKYKIGMTTRKVDKRVGEFSPLLPFESEIFAECPTGDALSLEKKLHNKFSEKRLNGEWFNLSDGDVIYIRSMSI